MTPSTESSREVAAIGLAARGSRLLCGGKRAAYVAVASLSTVSTASAFGQCEIDKLMASDGPPGFEFGGAVDICGDVAVVGGFSLNAAYIYRFNGSIWVQEGILLPDTPDGTFGNSVAIDGHVVAVGDIFDNENGAAAGAVYIFRFNSASSEWMLESKLLASDGQVADFFGQSVAVSSHRVVVGATGVDNKNGDSVAGAAYVLQFDGSDWFEEAKLIANDQVGGDLFGNSVGIEDDLVIVGAPGDDESASAHVFRLVGSEWVEEAELVDEDVEDGDLFGAAVAISGDVVVAGAHGDGPGSVFVFRYDGGSWMEEAKLVPPDEDPTGFLFGGEVSISGNVVVTSAIGNDDNGSFAGAAYVSRYDGSNWPESTKILASDGDEDDTFGRAVAVDGDVAIVGADQDGAGSAYIFAGLSGVDCNGNDVPDACDIDEGTSVDADGNGVPDECDCLWDLNGDGDVNVPDLVSLILAWGCNVVGPPDFDGDGTVGVTDLVELVLNWGPCD